MRRTAAESEHARILRAVDDPLAALQATVDRALAEIRELRAQHKDTRERLAALEHAVGPHDQRIREAFADSTQGDWFHAGDLLRHAHVDHQLHAVLNAAHVTSVHELGILLRRLRGIRFGVQVARRGRRWRVTRATGDLSSADVTIPLRP